ncbi:MAG TPA: hypothetical protein VMX94_10800 [Armatimonadota bacterium]|nr:hypothetical protein [Armatimonadota bacterium]
MGKSKSVPVWLLVVAIIALVITVVLKFSFDSIVAAFHPSGVIADMQLRNSLQTAMTVMWLVTGALLVAIIVVGTRTARR